LLCRFWSTVLRDHMVEPGWLVSDHPFQTIGADLVKAPLTALTEDPADLLIEIPQL